MKCPECGSEQIFAGYDNPEMGTFYWAFICNRCNFSIWEPRDSSDYEELTKQQIEWWQKFSNTFFDAVKEALNKLPDYPYVKKIKDD